MRIKIVLKVKINQFRDWMAWKFVGLAQWVRPKNEIAMTYFMELMQEAELEKMQYGKGIIEMKVKKHGKL